jgi:ABC-type antimicrobial peptide transport system permease subunit
MAQVYWSGVDPIGKCINAGRESSCTRVVGIVANARQGNITRLSIQYERPQRVYYVPLEQEPAASRVGLFGIMLYVRSSGDAAALVPAMRRIVPEGNHPGAALPDVTTFAAAIEPQIRPWRLGVMMFGLFGAIALLLAVVGLYGILAFRVSERQHEIGVRMSLGATRGDVHWLVLGEGLRLSALGVAIGLVVALTAGRALSTIVFGVSPRDPVILAMTGAALLAVAAIASALPAWRATRIDPMRVLRDL